MNVGMHIDGRYVCFELLKFSRTFIGYFAVSSDEGDVDDVEILYITDVNQKTVGGLSALSIASRHGDIDMVNKLLRYGAEIDTRDNLGRTPLRFAAARGHEYVVRRLLDGGADVNAQRNDDRCTSSLLIASQKGYIDIVHMLLREGAEIEAQDNLGRTPLWYAAANGHTMVLSALLSKGARIDARDNSGYTPLWIAAINGHSDLTHVLLRDEGDVKMLLKWGVQMEDEGDNDTGLVRGLLRDAEQMEAEDRNIRLWFAAANGRTAEVLALLFVGADVNVQNNDGVSALSVACEKGSVAVVTMLLKKDAQTEIRDHLYGRTPLWLAAIKGHVKCIELLIDRGAVVDALDYSGSSPVSAAAAKGRTGAVIKLMQHNANFTYNGECQDPLGITGLLHADTVETSTERTTGTRKALRTVRVGRKC